MTDHIAIICRDRPNAIDVRMAARPAHLEWIKAAPFGIAAAGPFLTDDGQSMQGSMIIVASGDLEAVRAWAAGDPYAAAGLFESVTIAPFRHLIGGGLPQGAVTAASS